MLAAIDAGSNTVRLLLGECDGRGRVLPQRYHRRICRLAGAAAADLALSEAGRQRTLEALHEYAAACRAAGVGRVRAVGTAAFRQAPDGADFAAKIRYETGLPFEVISGDLEASLTTAGVLSVIEPLPEQSLIVDIGGGSSELVLCRGRQRRWSCSLPLGVVRLVEQQPSAEALRQRIALLLGEALVELDTARGELRAEPLTVIGTAGTLTTLAALDMALEPYDWRRVNNYVMDLADLRGWYERLTPLSPAQRESLPGLETGRGDLIVAGLEIILALLERLQLRSLTVSDFGLLEGLLLSL
jgi:exopolyphosphatase/guanosine-5'-triphosphate,3'-diphosphate pyrophosphatase